MFCHISGIWYWPFQYFTDLKTFTVIIDMHELVEHHNRYIWTDNSLCCLALATLAHQLYLYLRLAATRCYLLVSIIQLLLVSGEICVWNDDIISILFFYDRISVSQAGVQHSQRWDSPAGQHPAPKCGNVGAGEVEWSQLDVRSEWF